jgi:hypothetical protein
VACSSNGEGTGLLHDPWPSALDGAATRSVPFVISLCTTLSSHAEAAGANAPNHGGVEFKPGGREVREMERAA